MRSLLFRFHFPTEHRRSSATWTGARLKIQGYPSVNGGVPDDNLFHRYCIRTNSILGGAESPHLRSSRKLPPESYYRAYRKALASIFSSAEFVSTKKMLLEQKLWTADNFDRLQQWLVHKTASNTALECWDSMREGWLREMTSSCRDEDTGHDAHSDAAVATRKKMQSYLATQRSLLEMDIFHTRGDPQICRSFTQMMHLIFHKLTDYCCTEGRKGRLRMFTLPILWQKMMEGGVVIKKAKSRLLLDRTETAIMMNVTDLLMNQEALLEELIIYHHLAYGDDPKMTVVQKSLLLLKHYFEKGDISAALAVLREIRSSESPIKFDLYIRVFIALIQNGELR